MNSAKERLVNGIVKENPTFVLMLGMCPTLAVTTSAVNGLGMGLTTMVVLALSNGYIPFLYDALGLYIPLIVVNCIILGRAEAYAYKNPVLPSLFDGIGMGLGFSVALTCIGAVRELLGAGEIFGIHVMPESFVPVSIFVMAPGAFFVLAVLTAIQNKVKIIGEKKGRDMSKIQSGCGQDCLNCADSGCAKRLYDDKEKQAPAQKKAETTQAPAQKTTDTAQTPEQKAADTEEEKAADKQVKEEKENG